MSILPSHNAYLTAVQGGGLSENYDADETAGSSLWSGEAEIFVYDELVTVLAGGPTPGRLDELSQTRMKIPSNLGLAITSEHTVVYVKDGVTHTRRVRDVKEYTHFGMVELRLADQEPGDA